MAYSCDDVPMKGLPSCYSPSDTWHLLETMFTHLGTHSMYIGMYDPRLKQQVLNKSLVGHVGEAAVSVVPIGCLRAEIPLGVGYHLNQKVDMGRLE